MNTIKFSHIYEKMPEYFEMTSLLAVFTADSKEFHEIFVKYDTLISILSNKGNVEYYQLPKGKVLVLLFMTGSEPRLWTTIRRWTPEKEKYYRSKIGQDFEIEIVESEKK